MRPFYGRQEKREALSPSMREWAAFAMSEGSGNLVLQGSQVPPIPGHRAPLPY